MTIDMQGILIVLGSPNAKDGRLYDIAVGRCKKALSEYKKHPDYKFLLTGGYGTHFNESNQPHACYLAQYLMDAGVSEKDILEYAESTNTIEDAILCKSIISKYKCGNIIVITSDYHLERAQYIFNRLFRDLDINISFKTAKSDIQNSELDILALIEHEKIALGKIKKYGLENYYKT